MNRVTKCISAVALFSLSGFAFADAYDDLKASKCTECSREKTHCYSTIVGGSGGLCGPICQSYKRNCEAQFKGCRMGVGCK